MNTQIFKRLYFKQSEHTHTFFMICTHNNDARASVRDLRILILMSAWHGLFAQSRGENASSERQSGSPSWVSSASTAEPSGSS